MFIVVVGVSYRFQYKGWLQWSMHKWLLEEEGKHIVVCNWLRWCAIWKNGLNVMAKCRFGWNFVVMDVNYVVCCCL